MSKKHHGISPNQISWPIEPPAIYGSEGSYVDLAERAEHLIIALDAVSERNSRRPGFKVASQAKAYNRPIRERYGSALPAVQMGAADNAAKFEKTTKRHLWQASGFAALRHMKPRLVSDSEIDARDVKMWIDFDATIGHTSHHEDRVKLRSQLVKTLERVHAYNVEIETEEAA